MKQFDIVVLGGGIYGLYTALFLSQREVTVAVIDIDQNFFSRASMVNQARLHNGLHYPRGQKTVNTILKYKERFIHDFGESINSQFKAYYAIANNESLTNKSEYEDFMNRNNIPYSEVDPNTLFNSNKVEALYLTKEYSYSYKIVLNKLLNHISDVKNVDTFSGTKVISITDKNERYQIEIENGEYIECKGVVNATYASTNIVSQLFNKPGFNLKYELCEVILCKVPDTLKDIGITVMDGEFFSIMPFGFSKYHTLTSVHYTPHTVSSPEPSFPCMKNGSCSPHNIGNCNLCLHKPLTAYEAMKTQYEEFIHPQLHGIEYISSMFAIKPIQISSEKTDERNTLIQMAKQPPVYISVLSGKISTFYELDSYLIELINLLKGS